VEFAFKEQPMSYVPIQFQRGLSMVEFIDRYVTEEKCSRALLAARWPKGFICPDCGGREHCLLEARGLYQCNRCHRQTSLKAGTIFHKSRLPLRKWFLAMHLLSQAKHSISILELKRQVGTCYSAAWMLKHKILQVMLEREKGRVLSERVEVDDAYMGGERHDGTSGRGTTGKIPFLAAVQTSTEENPDERRVLYIKVSVMKNFRSKTIRAWAKRSLAKTAIVFSDGMPAFNAIGKVVSHYKKVTMPGGWRSAKHPAFKWVNTVLGNLKGNVVGVTRWVSARHLPRYLAEFQWRFNRRFDLTTIFHRLLRSSVLTPPMPQKLLILAETCK
jgi:transposase-like protein